MAANRSPAWFIVREHFVSRRSRGRPSTALAPRRRRRATSRAFLGGRARAVPGAGRRSRPARRTRRSTRARDVADCPRARSRRQTSSRAARLPPCGVSASAVGEGARGRLRPPRAGAPRALAAQIRVERARSSRAHPRARVSFLGDVAAARGPSWNLARGALPPRSARGAGGVLGVRRRLPRGRARAARVPRGDHRQPRGGALRREHRRRLRRARPDARAADTVLVDVDKIGSGAASVLETASREAGVLQRRLSDLPNTASRTLMEAITAAIRERVARGRRRRRPPPGRRRAREPM